MRLALDQARQAWAQGEVPVGAVVLDAEQTCIAQGYNRTITDSDPTAHAEILAMRSAGLATGNYRLTGLTLYVTLEPCAMCAGAISHARLGRVVFAAEDAKGGGVVHGPKIFDQPTTHWRPKVDGGLFAEEAAALLRNFFRARRS